MNAPTPREGDALGSRGASAFAREIAKYPPEQQGSRR